MKRFIIFLRDLVLFLVAYILTLPVEILTFLVVLFKYGTGALDYFKGEGYSFDIKSASRNRSLWNLLFLPFNAYLFKSDTKKSISWHLGVNSLIDRLTCVGWLMYYLLYLIDFTKWNKGGHCRSIVTEADLEMVKNELGIE